MVNPSEPTVENRALCAAFEALADAFDQERNPAEFTMYHLRLAVAAYLRAAESLR